MADDYSDDKNTTGTLSPGGTAVGTLEPTGDQDWFSLELKENHGYYFTPRMQNGQVPIIGVWYGGPELIGYTNELGLLFTNELHNPFVPWKSGTYYLKIGQGKESGAYTVGMSEAADDSSNEPEAARMLTTAAPVGGRFDYAFDKDQFRINAVAGTTYTVTVSTDSGNLGPAKFLRLTHEGQIREFVESGAKTSYSFTAKTSGEHLFTATMASYDPPAPGGLAYHMTLSAADRTAPTAVKSTATVDGPIVVTLSEDARIGSNGVIELRHQNSRELVASWSAGDPGIHLVGNMLTLERDTIGAIMPGSYRLEIGGDILLDASGNIAKSYPLDYVDVKGTAGGGMALIGYPGEMRGSANKEDAVIFEGSRADYSLLHNGDAFTVRMPKGGISTLYNIERIMFSDSDEVIALSLDGRLGQAFRLYTAAFDRMPDQAGLGFWLDAAERGVSLPDMARGFIGSPEFSGLYGAHPDDSAFVAALYRNVLHRPGEKDGVAFWLDALGKGTDRGDVLAAFSESPENQQQAAALIGTSGITYTAYH